MFKPKRLHPISIFINVGKRVKNLIFPLLGLIFIGSRNKDIWGISFTLVILVVAVLITLFISIFSWLRYTYRMEDDELRIEYGIVIKKKRYIPLERIQSIDLSEGILQRMFGLVQVKIETAGGSEDAEAVLSAISKEEARFIQEFAASAKSASSKEAEITEEGSIVYRISTAQLFILSLTSGGVGVVLSAVLALFSQMDDFIPYKKLFGNVEKWAASSIMVIAIFVFVGFLLAWVIALVGTMLKYANFTIKKTEFDLVISQGLLERRQLTIPLKRIQAIRINENMIRQLLGYSTVFLESAGGSASNQEGSKVMLLPIVKLNKIAAILEPFINDYQLNTTFTPVPKRAMRRYIFRSWFVMVPIVAISLIFFKAWGLLSLIFLAWGTFWAILKYKDAGWAIEQQQLSLRYRTLVRTTVYIRKNKLQSLEVNESFFQRKKSLGSIEAFVKSGIGGAGGRVIDLEKSDLERIFSWYSR